MSKKINSKQYETWSKEELIKEIIKIKSITYGLVWHRDLPEEKIDILVNPDARTPNEMFPNEMSGKPFPVLKEVKEKAISLNKSKLVNFLIEGDNYHSLAVLNFTHRESIDLIYIDPPYNTGNKDFIYNDKFVDKEDSFRHSKWLSFMEKRLKLAKNLLKDSGVIFISIDDNEQAPLKMLCDEIFGENNCIGPFIQNKLNAKNDTLNIQKNHEYILVYRRKEIKKDGKTVATLVNKKEGIKEVIKENEKFYFIGDPITTRGAGGILNARKNLGYTIYYNPITGDFKGVMDYNIELAKTSNNENEVYLDDADLKNKGYICIRPPKVRGKLGAWTWDCNRFNSNHHEILIKKTRTNTYNIYKKIFVENSKVYEVDGKYFLNDNKTGNSKSIIEFSTNEGTDSYNEILEPGTFNNPKNVEMLKYLISLYDKKDAIVLDFFAGSGTTGQAVLELNIEDDGQRSFILCTNNGDEKSEHKIASDICYPRIKNILKGYKKVSGEEITGLSGNLKYYITDFVEAEPTDRNKRKLVKESTEMLCILENAFQLIQDNDEFKIFKNTDKYVGVIFYEEAIENYKKIIKEISGHFNTYVFSMGDDPHINSFTDIKDKVTLCAIPEVILKVYREIFK